MLVSIIILATFILPVFLHRLVQKYGIFEVPDEVLYENILAVSSGRSYGIGQAVVGSLGVWIGTLYKSMESLSNEKVPYAIMFFAMSLVFLILFLFFALFMRNWVLVFCVDGIVHRTAFGKVRYYPDSSIKGYYYFNRSREIRIKTIFGTIGTNWNCSNYRLIKTLVQKYPRINQLPFTIK